MRFPAAGLCVRLLPLWSTTLIFVLAFPLPGKPTDTGIAAEQATPLLVGAVPPIVDTPANKWGEITIAQPKVWQYERVNALLDGLLRDVEGVSLADLTQLDPNKQNAAAIKFVQSALGIAVQYDQAAQVNASNALQTWQAKHDSEVRQLEEYNNYMQGLTAQRDSLTRQLFATNNEIVALQSQKDQGNFSDDQAKQLQAATDRATTLNSQLKDVNGMITSAGAVPFLTTPPTVTGTSAAAPQLPTPSTFADLLKSLPDSVQKGLGNALQSPSYPATKQLDNFITLLHERLAREISVMQDDLIRDPNTFAYLVQFDVGLYPSKKSKNHMARVEFDLKGCTGCKVYSLYPGQSSYNVANYQGSSKRRSFWLNAATLIGLGISANYQRQEDALKGSLVQSVYVSGFQNDEDANPKINPSGENHVDQRFGWYYNAAPFDEYVTPGIRSTFAIITVPRQTVRGATAKSTEASQAFPLTFSTTGTWPKRDDPMQPSLDSSARTVKVHLPATKNLIELPSAVEDDSQRLHVLRMEYNTITYKEPEATTIVGTIPASSGAAATPTPAPATATTAQAYPQVNGCKKDECAAILLSLDAPIDPNLVVTVFGKPLHRVRDWRGRATSVLPPVQSLSDIGLQPAGVTAPKSQSMTSRSLLETDQLEPNSWFAVTSHDLLLNISRDLAGEEIFPIIQISDPGKRTLVIPNDLRQNYTEIIFDGFRLLPGTKDAIRHHIASNFVAAHQGNVQEEGRLLIGGPYPYSTFGPLFVPNPAPLRFYAFVGQTGDDLIIGFQRGRRDESAEARHYEFLEARTSVILEDKDLDLGWSLSCTGQGEELVCKLPSHAIRGSYEVVAEECLYPFRDCGSIQPLVHSLQAAWFANSVSLGSAAFAPNLQVWVSQSDPEEKLAFWSPEPAKIGLFPIGNTFVNARRFKAWRFNGAHTTPYFFGLEACNYFGELPDLAAVHYLSPLEFSTNLVEDPLIPDFQGSDCGYILLPTLTLQRPEIVLQMDADEFQRWTDAIPTSRLRPEFGKSRIEPIFDHSGTTEHRNRIAGWDVRIPVNRAHCKDRIDISQDYWNRLQQALDGAKKQLGSEPRAAFEWLNGTTPIQPDQVPYVAGDQCTQAWWQAQSAGQIQLHFAIPKQAVKLLPSELHLIRTSSNSVKIDVARLPSLRKLILPSKVKVESIGESQFALRGANAGAIDAVAVQNGGFADKYDTGSGVDFALVNAVKKKVEKIKPEEGKPTGATEDVKPSSADDKTKQAATGVGAAQKADEKQKKADSPQQNGDKKKSPPSGANAGDSHAVDKPPAGSRAEAKKKPKTKTTLVPLASGTYALVPLIRDGNNYVPIEVTDEQGKALTFTVPAKKDDAKKKEPTEPDVTVTITKTTKKPSPSATPSPTPK